MQGELFPQKIIVPFPYRATELCLLETIVIGPGDRQASCSTNKGDFRRLHRSRYVILNTPSIVRVKNEWNYDFTAL
jgi:hypothetical protein